jgi:membrane protein implicated in regulation of membrane protease activity
LLRGRPPYSVVAFAAFVAVIFVVALAREGPHQKLIGGGLVLLILTVALVRGVWLSWLALTAIAVGDVIVGVLKWPGWAATSIVVINGIMLALLLTRATRRHARRGRPRFLAVD